MTGSHMPAVEKYNSGFTLVEIAMVLFIITLLLAGLLPTITVQLEQHRTNETRKQISDIQQALMGFAIANGRLPCPAQATLATGQNNVGEEATKSNTCACKSSSGSDKTVAYSAVGNVACDTSAISVTGVLPWVTLGLKETDAWDHRFTYRVTTIFADQIIASTTNCTPALSTAPTASSFALCSPGVPDVVSAFSGGTAVATDVPAIFVSHGKNGYGAYIGNGTQLAGATGDEAENSNNDNTFVSHTPTSSFDDMPAWIVPGILFNRMVAAGKLP